LFFLEFSGIQLKEKKMQQRSPDAHYDRCGVVLGEGSYGKVYLAYDRKTGEKVALKKMSLEQDFNGIPVIAMREVAILKELSSHPNIVTLEDVLYNDNHLYLVFEWLDRDLRRYLDEVDHVNPLLVRSYLFQTLQGIRACHAHRILHRDLKPQNLLIDSNGRLKLADFGLSRGYDFPVRDRVYSKEVVTLWYRAPELLLGNTSYSTPIDIWSIGCIFAELASKRPLFPGDSEIQQLHKIFSVLGTPPGIQFETYPRRNLAHVVPELDELGINLLEQMLDYNNQTRISAKDALQHPYFDAFKKYLLENNNLEEIEEWWL